MEPGQPTSCHAVTPCLFPRKKGAAEVLGEKQGDNSDDEAGMRVKAPWQPVLEQTRALYRLALDNQTTPQDTQELAPGCNAVTRTEKTAGVEMF
ncbi:MAG TPA: hypothetical protein VEU33_23155 [Archangium sp.]|nr:hypothetical protein [Archangium sp.]